MMNDEDESEFKDFYDYALQYENMGLPMDKQIEAPKEEQVKEKENGEDDWEDCDFEDCNDDEEEEEDEKKEDEKKEDEKKEDEKLEVVVEAEEVKVSVEGTDAKETESD